jgi:hypothetical protein
MTDRDDDLAKVAFRIAGGGEVDVETPWARRVGVNTYVLDNLPWYAYGISVGDTFEAIPSGDGLPEFTRVIAKSGNRTVRVILKPSAKESAASQAVLDRLRAMGCDYEGMNSSYIAVNIPPNVSLDEVCSFLTDRDQQWEHADPTYEDLHG